jgi:hypothetical protein
MTNNSKIQKEIYGVISNDISSKLETAKQSYSEVYGSATILATLQNEIENKIKADYNNDALDARKLSIDEHKLINEGFQFCQSLIINTLQRLTDVKAINQGKLIAYKEMQDLIKAKEKISEIKKDKESPKSVKQMRQVEEGKDAKD